MGKWTQKLKKLAKPKINKKEIALLVLTVGIQLSLLIALAVELVAYTADTEWNSILKGEKPFPEKNKTCFFYGKTIELDKELWSNEEEQLVRDRSYQVVYIIIIPFLFFLVFTHQLLFFTHKPLRTGEKYKTFLLWFYMLLGFIILITLALEASSITSTKNNMISVHSKLYHKIQKKQDYTSIPFADLNEMIFLKDILGVCIHHSVYMHLNPNNNYPGGLMKEIMLYNRETYTFEKLKSLGFCPLDVCKLISVMFALLAMLLCWIIPCLLGFFMSVRKPEAQLIPRLKNQRPPEFPDHPVTTMLSGTSVGLADTAGDTLDNVELPPASSSIGSVSSIKSILRTTSSLGSGGSSSSEVKVRFGSFL